MGEGSINESTGGVKMEFIRVFTRVESVADGLGTGLWNATARDAAGRG